MALKEFTLAALAEIDNGKIREAFEQAMRRCELDCRDRPGLDKARKLSLTVNFIPELDEHGEMDSCLVTFQIADSLPDRKSKTFRMHAERGGLLFNELSPTDPRQGTIDELHGKLGPKGASDDDNDKKQEGAVNAG